MKNPVCFCVLILSAYLISDAYAGVSREQMEKMADGFRKTCIGKTGADLSLVQGIRNGEFIDDPNSKCYAKCIMGLMRTFTKQGTIDIDMLLKQITIMADASIVDGMVANSQKCYEQTSSDDPCELAWLFTKCVYEADPSTFFFP